MHADAMLTGAVASLERRGYDLFDSLRHFGNFGPLIVHVVAAPQVLTMAVIVQPSVHPPMKFCR